MYEARVENLEDEDDVDFSGEGKSQGKQSEIFNIVINES